MELIVGGDYNYPPYEFLDESGEPTGYNVELTRAIAEVMGMQVEIRLGDWGKMRTALEQGDIDVLQGISFSKERAELLDFSPPHAIIHHSIWSRKEVPVVSSVKDLAGKVVVLQRGGTMHDFLLKSKIDVSMIFTDTHGQALRLLILGTYDYAVVAELPGQYLVKKLHAGKLLEVTQPIAAQSYGYAVVKGKAQLLARFSEGLVILKKTGKFQVIRNKWLGVLDPKGVAWNRIIGYGLLILVPLLLSLTAMGIWSQALKKQVALRTQALEQEMRDREKATDELILKQKQLIQADKMASLGILVAGMAHEINNPTGLILLNLPILIEAYQDAEPILEEYYETRGDFELGGLPYSRMRDQIPHMLEEMNDGAHRIKRIVEDLKDFARLEDSNLNTWIDLNEVTKTAVRLVNNSIHKATNHFSVNYAPDIPKFKGNAQRIEQVIINLILNACQALPNMEAGITLSTIFDESANTLVFEIQDEGCGVKEEYLAHLTDPFFTTKREVGGTGLGLSVSAGIIQDHGAKMNFSSLPEQGLTAIVTFPVSPKEIHHA